MEANTPHMTADRPPGPETDKHARESGRRDNVLETRHILVPKPCEEEEEEDRNVT
jgi:hypothetical protein